MNCIVSQESIKMYNKEVKSLNEKGKKVLLTQENLPLDFFLKSKNPEKDYYFKLYNYLMPYNIGRHYSLGTKNLKKYAKKFDNDVLNKLLKDIEYDLMKINFYIENNEFKLRNLKQIGSRKVLIRALNVPLHRHFLNYIKKYYTLIFPSICSLDKLAEQYYKMGFFLETEKSLFDETMNWLVELFKDNIDNDISSINIWDDVI